MVKQKPDPTDQELTWEKIIEALQATFPMACGGGVSLGGVTSADYYTEVERHRFVSSSDKLVCTGERFGSYNYDRMDNVFPSSKRLIPIRNHFGDIDYKLNPHYKGE